MVVFITFVAVLFLAVAWLAIYTQMGIIPAGTWKRLFNRLFGVERTTYSTDTRKFGGGGNREEEAAFHDVFDAMDQMNVSEVESFKAYGYRTFYFTCRKCRQKNRLGTDLKKFKDAGCGKCHAKFARPADVHVN